MTFSGIICKCDFIFLSSKFESRSYPPKDFQGVEGVSWSQSQQSLGEKNVSRSGRTHMCTVKFPRKGPCSNMKWRITLLNSKLCKASVSRRAGVSQ